MTVAALIATLLRESQILWSYTRFERQNKLVPITDQLAAKFGRSIFVFFTISLIF